MTPSALQQLSAQELDAFFATLVAETTPLFWDCRGEAWMTRFPRLTRRLFGWVWSGKVFSGTRVWNRILGHLMIKGSVRLEPPDIVIDYPHWHLQDRLRLVTERLYLGRMRLGAGFVYFTLEPA